MKYIKTFEKRITPKLGSMYKFTNAVDRVFVAKLTEIFNANYQGTFEGYTIYPEEYKTGELRIIHYFLYTMTSKNIPTKKEIQEYELLKIINKYNL